MEPNKNIKIIVNYILGPLVFLVLTYSIYRQLSAQVHWKQSIASVAASVRGPGQWKAWLTLTLMGLNWGLEARKWQYCLCTLQEISFFSAWKAVFAGLAIASFTPNRVGEYVGRLLFIAKGKRLQSVSVTIVGSLAQFMATIVFGILGILYLQWWLRTKSPGGHPLLYLSLNTLSAGIVLVLLILLVLYFRLPWLVSRLRRMDRGGKWLNYVKVVQDLPNTVLLMILCLSFVRYLVFLAQYGLMFSLFGVVLTWQQLFGGVAVLFLVMAILPTLTFFTDLGLRWTASIQIMELFSANTIGIFAASLGIWLVNLVLPALIGSLLILRIKIFSLDEGS